MKNDKFRYKHLFIAQKSHGLVQNPSNVYTMNEARNDTQFIWLTHILN